MAMSLPSPEELEERTLGSLLQALLVLGAFFVGALIAVFFLPVWAPAVVESFLGSNPKAYWPLSRSSGVIAYLLLWLAAVLGLLITNKFAHLWNGGPAAADLHGFVSLLGLAFTLFHVVILLGDRYIRYTPLQLAIPFASVNFQPFWVGVGQIGFYLLIPIAFSFYVRRWIGHDAWRWLHYASFIGYALTTLHSLFAGTDTRTPLMLMLYAVTGASVCYLSCYRVLTAKGATT